MPALSFTSMMCLPFS